MALIVETGTGLANADSYVSLADASAYHAALNQFDWFEDEGALRIATQALDLLYGSRFAGERLTDTQALLWPRKPFVDRIGVKRPQGVAREIRTATFELALLHLQGVKLISDPDRNSQVRQITNIVGDLEQTQQFFAPVSTSKLRKVSLILAPLFVSGDQPRLIRA